MANKTLTGALAILKVNGQAIGKMKTIRVNENFTRGDVRGIGQLTPIERNALSWAGTVTCDFYNIDFRLAQIPGAILRSVQTLQEFIDNLVLKEDGIQLDIYQKVPASVDPVTGFVSAEEYPYASIKGLYIDTQGFDITEGQISGRNETFTFIHPIIYPK